MRLNQPANHGQPDTKARPVESNGMCILHKWVEDLRQCGGTDADAVYSV